MWRCIPKAIINFIYPNQCLHCKRLLGDVSTVLCSPCASAIELLNPQGRCAKCFKQLESPHPICPRCLHRPSPFTAVASASEYKGPLASLIRTLKYHNQPSLAQGLAGLLAAQLLRLEWPLPDVIVPVPVSKLRLWDRGYNQCDLLADELGKMLGCSYERILKRQAGGWSQAGLSMRKRTELNLAAFSLRKDKTLYEKKVLLIDDVLTTGSTLQACASAISAAFPEKIYGLTLATTEAYG